MVIQPIQRGQTIGIVTPARKVDDQLLLKGCEVIKSWGLNVKMGKHCFSNKPNYLAASDEERLDDMQRMLDDPSVVAIFCARGGYGTTRIVDRLNFDNFLKKPKWIVGFSDITALHLKLHELGIESIHGCMPTQYSKPEYKESVDSLIQILFEGKDSIIEVPSNKRNKQGKATGKIIGGNLSLVVDSLGTDGEVDTNGKILILEEIDEPLYKIDRMLTQLKRAKKFSHLSGLVIGHMTDIKDTELPFGQSIEELVLDKIESYQYPVAFDFPIGHQAPNIAWRYSSMATLAAEADRAMLTFG
ncbi:MAG: LD-carboxypeptidase [Cyclobacteriaceae bacterium]